MARHVGYLGTAIDGGDSDSLGEDTKEGRGQVRLTKRVLKAMISALSSATAGGPEDMGLDDSEESENTFSAAGDALQWAREELARRNAKAERARGAA